MNIDCLDICPTEMFGVGHVCTYNEEVVMCNVLIVNDLDLNMENIICDLHFSSSHCQPAHIQH